MRICTRCKKDKEDEEFAFKNKVKGTRKAKCRTCQSDDDKILYLTDQTRRENIRGLAILAIKKAKEFSNRVKRCFGCKNCRDKRFYVLDFHHVNCKDKDISILIRQGATIERLKNEMRKCEVLCSNCHRETHYLKNQKVM